LSPGAETPAPNPAKRMELIRDIVRYTLGVWHPYPRNMATHMEIKGVYPR